MEIFCERYRANGYLAARFEPAAFLKQGEDFAVADIAWHIARGRLRALALPYHV